MKEYSIVWKIELSANSFEKAADEALDYIINGDGKLFMVTEIKTGKEKLIEAKPLSYRGGEKQNKNKSSN